MLCLAQGTPRTPTMEQYSSRVTMSVPTNYFHLSHCSALVCLLISKQAKCSSEARAQALEVSHFSYP
ncbi:hypothetical protein Lalb_Chr18g0053101 [Lupinus albus]|uniref:Uncharacterized protein n=1 Tax=Lupinus albus TaxID=3870 RepID=A0A6A4NQD0_LUPAL|nr:hypothetical protein Lalb_Chr18g0053101 [Lupinus albus]